MRPMRVVWITLLTTLFTCSAFAGEFAGRVVGVIDGDTIDVIHNGEVDRIRLHGIDCPEKGQPFGTRAKQATAEHVFGKDVTVAIHGKDKYKRTIAEVLLPDGTNVNRELVGKGWCWWYRKYAPEEKVLEQLEQEAREAHTGLWAEPLPVPPWEWRKR